MRPAAPHCPPPVAIPVTASETESREREIPGAVPGFKEQFDWDERLGPVGVTVGAVAACVLVWALAIVLNLL